MGREPVLQLRGVSKSFGPVQVLHGVDLTVRAGEVTALVGDNGAGKSTLVRCVAGLHPFDSGEVFFDGRPVSIHGPADASRHGVEVVYQDLALADNLDIVQNMFLGRERGRRWLLDEADMEKAARRTLAALSVRTVSSVRLPVAALSGGQRQTVAIAKAALWNSRLVLLDEPTAALGVAQTRQVLDLVRELAAQGLAVVLISHNLADVFEVSDRIAVLYLGRLVAETMAATVTHGQVVELITAGRSDRLAGPPAEAPAHDAGKGTS
jgi:D-xylose transport system ATP-binding protein